MHPKPDLDLDALQAHGAWLKRLVRSMVADPSLADDISQDAWLVALTHPRNADTPLRRWLALVARNLVRDRARAELRRAEHSAHAARPEAGEAEGATLERLEIQERVVAAVKRLDEPYRTAIVMRYLEERSLEEIARRTRTPVRTVQTRLRRALERLRDQLDRDQGRGAWLGALLPLIGWN